jgi:hypothetical protein
MLAAPACGTEFGFDMLEHPEAAEINAKMIIVQTMDNRRDMK